MNETELQSVLDLAGWTFAKTMKSIPHEWTCKHNWKDKELFKQVVVEIRKLGVPEKFYGKTYLYYYYNGYKYWTMGAELDITIIINRAKAQ